MVGYNLAMVRSFEAQIIDTSEWNLGKERQTAGPGSLKPLSGCCDVCSGPIVELAHNKFCYNPKIKGVRGKEAGRNAGKKGREIRGERASVRARDGYKKNFKKVNFCKCFLAYYNFSSDKSLSLASSF